MSREQAHKGSGHPRKKQDVDKDRNAANQTAGSAQQIIQDEEAAEGQNLDERPLQGERAQRAQAGNEEAAEEEAAARDEAREEPRAQP